MATELCGTSGGHDDGGRLVLHNPLILHEIFSYLDTKTLKAVRLVCKGWEDEGASILGKRCLLLLHRINYCYNKKDEPVSLAVNSKFLKRISIVEEMFYGSSFQRRVARLRFSLFVSMWHNVVQEMSVDTGIDFCAYLPAALNAYGFPNLTKLTIRELLGIDVDLHVQFRSINTLKELHIIGSRFFKDCSYLLLQNLIYSAPNLEVLDLEGNFYPNLESCRKLKVLKWVGFLFASMGVVHRGIELHEVFRIINEVGDHLEHLTLGLDFEKGPIFRFCIRKKLKMGFPNLTKLKSLTIKKIDFLQVAEQICPSLLPSLEMVSFQFKYGNETSGIDQSYLTHHGVTSLELTGVKGPHVITVASKRFPNVNRLVMKIAMPLQEDFTGAHFLGTILETCSTWKLLYLEVQIDNMKLSQVLEGLKSLRLLEGLKEVCIVQGDKLLTDDDDDLDYVLKEVLQLSAKIDRMIFKGFKLKPTTKEQVLQFQNDHKDLQSSAWID